MWFCVCTSRTQHQALDALWVGIMRKKVNWILGADIRGFTLRTCSRDFC